MHVICHSVCTYSIVHVCDVYNIMFALYIHIMIHHLLMFHPHNLVHIMLCVSNLGECVYTYVVVFNLFKYTFQSLSQWYVWVHGCGIDIVNYISDLVCTLTHMNTNTHMCTRMCSCSCVWVCVRVHLS